MRVLFLGGKGIFVGGWTKSNKLQFNRLEIWLTGVIEYHLQMFSSEDCIIMAWMHDYWNDKFNIVNNNFVTTPLYTAGIILVDFLY